MTSKTKAFWICLALLIAESLGLIYMSFLPAVSVVPAGFLRPGDLEHFAAYAIYGSLLVGVLGQKFKGNVLIMMCLAVGFFVGCLTEIIQFFVTYREADIIDCFVDGLGVLVGSVIMRGFISKMRIKNLL